ncbi:MAG: family 20 glycosylhydrolase [Bacteroidia bacterium]
MKKSTIIFFFLLAYLPAPAAAQDSLISIIPKPVQLKKGTGFAHITPQWNIYVPNVAWNSEAEVFNNYLDTNYGFSLPVLNSVPKGKNFILLKKSPGDALSKEYYHLSVKQNNISIEAGEAPGIFYGLQTLMQLFNTDNSSGATVPQVELEDYPRLKWRGMHLDVCRHFFPKEAVKKYIDYLSRYKMNVFHWHLTDDQGWRIEIKSHPELTKTGAWRNGSMVGPYSDQQVDTLRYGGFYSQEDIREVVAYAAKHHVTIVPEIEMPGHSVALLAAAPQLSCTGGPFETGKIWGVYEDILCPKEETFKFLEDVLAEVCELFPGKYIHTGGDEVPKTRWKNCEHCQQLIQTLGLKNETELQSYFIGRIEKFLNSKGKLVIGWDEIMEGGLTGSAAIMSWQGEKGGIAAAKQKHVAVMTPGDYCYFDHYQSANRDEPLAFGGYTPVEKVYAYEPVPQELNREEKNYILGAQANLWTEYIPDFSQVEYMIFPRMCALAEVVWTPALHKNYDDFRQRLLRHFLYFEKNHINYSKAIFDIKIIVTPTEEYRGLHILFEAFKEETDEIHYTIDGTEPRAELPVIDTDFKIYNSTTVKAALFGPFLKNGTQKGKVVEQKFNLTKATGKKITLAVQPSEKYNTGGAFTLVNGITGDLPWRGSDWLGFTGEHLDAVIDFGVEETFSKITLDVLEDSVSWIYLPKSVEVFSSDDGIYFKSLVKISADAIKLMKRKLIFETGTIHARYIKVIAENAGVIPAGCPGAGNAAWLFVDEIGVE